MQSPGRNGANSRPWILRSEVWLFGLIVAAAAAVRFWRLAEIPDGLHGDEAWTGLDARRILREGWIGPYVPSALGQPTGLLYVVAGMFLWLPDDVWTIRAVIAVTGTLGIAFTYLTAREYEGPVFAGFAAALLAGMLWHMHGSRMGMMFVSYPTMLMAGLWVQAMALRRRSVAASLAAGFVAGLGLYGYNAYPTALPLYAIPFVWFWFTATQPGQRRRWWLCLGAFAIAAAVAAAPMIRFAARDPDSFFRHHRQVSVFASPGWNESDWPARAEIIATRARFWLEGMFLTGRFDSGDGFGAGGIPLVDPITAFFAAIGLTVAVVRWRRPLSLLTLAALPIISSGALLTFGPGPFRRTIGLAPFVALAAAAALRELCRGGRWLATYTRSTAPLAAAWVLALAAVFGAVAIDVRTYFGGFAEHAQVRWVFARELRQASEFLAGVPRETRVYFFSERWSCNYETRRYLAPDIDCVDRSQRFGTTSSRSGLVDFSTPSGKPALLLLMGEYLRQFDNLVQRHPEAERDTGEIDGVRTFAAIYLPEGTARKFGLPAAIGDRGGPTVSLTALEPKDVRFDFAPPMVDRTWNGHSLLLGERRFMRGLGMHAPTEMVYQVPAGVVRFTAVVGLPPQVDDCAKASVDFEVTDTTGRVLASTGVMRPGDPPRTLRADLEGISEVVLVAGDAGDGRDCDHANWGNPLFLRTPRRPSLR